MRKIIVLIIAALITNIFFSSQANAALVGYWDFNEGLGTTAYDSSGFNNNGSFNANTADWVQGKYGSGLLLNNNDGGGVVIPDSSSLHFTDAFTLMAWVDFDNEKIYQIAISKYTPNQQMGFSLHTSYHPDTLKFWEFDSTVTNVWSLGPAEPNVWQHVAVTYDGSETKLYLDGVVNNSTPSTGSLFVNNTPLIIGALNTPTPPTGGYQFNGIIDEVRIYNNALTQNEILRDMNSDSKSPVVPEPATMFLFGSGLLGAFIRRKFA